MQRDAGLLLQIEKAVIRLLHEHADARPHGLHGYELADLLCRTGTPHRIERTDAARLRSNGTIYKVLFRLRRCGAIEDRWEDAELALADGRPRRRYHSLTDNGFRRARNLKRRDEPRRYRPGSGNTFDQARVESETRTRLARNAGPAETPAAGNRAGRRTRRFGSAALRFLHRVLRRLCRIAGTCALRLRLDSRPRSADGGVGGAGDPGRRERRGRNRRRAV